MNETVKSTCPICEESIALQKNILAGELITCGGCGGDLEVVSNKDDVALAVAPEVQEDWGE